MLFLRLLVLVGSAMEADSDPISKLIESASFLLMSLPIIAFACLWCLTTFSEREDWRVGFLKAAVLWGSTTLLITELLSVFAAIRPTTLALAWILVIASSLYVIRRHIVEEGVSPLVVARKLLTLPAGDRWWIVPLVPAAAIALTTAVIALVAPPNNWDSMTYHLSRVEHWRVHHSVAHYPTNVTWQLYLNPWAEFAILQFQTLGFGSDRLANLVQWFAFVGSMVSVSLLVRILGGASFAQSLAALVVATTPMIILQSTSTQNDLVCGFFVVTAVYFLFERLATSTKHELYFPLSVALAIATKGTAYLILAPFVAYAFIGVSKQEGIRGGVRLAGMLIIAALLLNAGHWTRNLSLWHHPLGDPKWLVQYQNESFGISETFSNVVRNAALHVVTPSERVNILTYSAVRRVLGPLDQVVPDTRFLTHEDYAGNGLAFVLFVVAVSFAILTKAGRRIRLFAILLLMSGLFFCVFLQWSIFNSRLHTPLFLLAAAAVACVFVPTQLDVPNRNEMRDRRAVLLGGLMVSILTLTALPWVALNQLRPLISTQDAPSIFDRSRIEQMFANKTSDIIPYTELVSLLAQRVTCREIGLKIQLGAFEYPLWQIARHAGADLTFRHVNITNESAKLGSHSADTLPCAIAVISLDEKGDPDLSSFENMHIVWSRPPIRLLAR
jgi:Dolichyl-phosphate-mannose-protein mannosyltransferase